MQLQRAFLSSLITVCLCACNFQDIREQDTGYIPAHPDSITNQSTRSTINESAEQIVPDSDVISIVDSINTDKMTDAGIIPDDVWQRIRQGLSLARHTDKRSVKDKIAWYARNQEYLDRVAERATPYIYYITGELEKRGMPMELALLPIVESAYQPFAHSPSRASGIWQFISSTGKRYGLKQNWWYDGRRDIVASTDAALNYLQTLNKMFNGNWQHALAAYNTGEFNVSRAIKRNREAGKETDFWSLKLPRETRGYVPSLLAVAEIVAQPEKYNITLKKIPNTPSFAVVNVDSQIDLATAARLADLSMDELYTLNPGFNRWATDPSGPHRLLIPIENAEQFTQELAVLPTTERVSWIRHEIRKGETLGQIARQYRTSVTALKQTNNLRSNIIRAGHSLLIATSAQPLDHYTLSADTRRFRGLKSTGDGKKYIYTVTRGDNLWDLSRSYGTSVRELCRWNGISRNTILRPGQKLAVWINDDETESDGNFIKVAANHNQAYAGTDQNQQIEYTIREGDSLWIISRRFNVSVADICQWNRIQKGKILQPGQNLIILVEAQGA